VIVADAYPNHSICGLPYDISGDLRDSRSLAHRTRIDIVAMFNVMTVEAISDLDLSHTPPLGSPWDTLQHGAQAWDRQALDRSA
jgi:hypothetical protein